MALLDLRDAGHYVGYALVLLIGQIFENVDNFLGGVVVFSVVHEVVFGGRKIESFQELRPGEITGPQPFLLRTQRIQMLVRDPCATS